MTTRLTKSALHRMILEEIESMLDVEHPSEIEPVEDAWAGGPNDDNLESPIDHAAAAGGEAATRQQETMGVVAEHKAFSPMRSRASQFTRDAIRKSHSAYRLFEGDPDEDNDGVIDRDELYTHFDVDGDGIVTKHDYADHVKYHCENPEILAPFERVKLESAPEAICPDSYNKAGDTLVKAPSVALEMIRPVMELTGIDCPASAARALADVIETAQNHDVITH